MRNRSPGLAPAPVGTIPAETFAYPPTALASLLRDKVLVPQVITPAAIIVSLPPIAPSWPFRKPLLRLVRVVITRAVIIVSPRISSGRSLRQVAGRIIPVERRKALTRKIRHQRSASRA